MEVPMFDWLKFNWMNRTLYHIIKYFILYFGGFIGGLTVLTIIAMLFKHMVRTYDEETIKAIAILIFIAIMCFGFACGSAFDAVATEKRRNERIEAELKKD